MRDAERHVLVVTVALSLALSPTAASGERPASVKALLKQGAKDYRLSNFREALTAFKKALALENKPSTILNVAQCHRQLGERERALFYYRLYLTEWERANPDKPSPYLEEVEGHIKQLTVTLEREKRPVVPPERVEPPAASRVALTVPSTQPAPPPADTPVRRPIYKRWWFWTAIGLVVAGAAAGGAAAAASKGGQDLPRYTPGNF
jgi:tetratricopeptide (TPR) repeat protein